MYALKNRTILIISPQAWGKMFVSKHHYAVELAKYGNIVFFLNPPEKNIDGGVQIKAMPEFPDLHVISHSIRFPYNIKFHAIGIFHWLMQWQVKKILKAINKPVDIIWSFDLGNLYPFRLFPKNIFRIFHPVDEPLNNTAINSAKGALVIFSVTQEILEKYKQYKIPAHFINHGIGDFFLKYSDTYKPTDKKRVGFSGNLLRADIDRPVLLQIINENPDVIFECWGSYEISEANISGEFNDESAGFIKSLQALPNVILYGAVSSAALVAGYSHMDAFLICYDIEKDQSKGTNYHKVMEFISTGKVIISNNISTYKALPNLVNMVTTRENNNELPALFKSTMLFLGQHNTAALISYRKNYAMQNTYRKQIERIEQLL
jgi:glycosyltransferase involved in cell wall biosynthesis